jgi:hypothetical protein
MMNKIIPISKKAQKKLWLARYLALVECNGRKTERHRWVTGRTDQGWQDASDRARTLLYFDLTLNRVRSVKTGRVGQQSTLLERDRTRPITSQSRPIRLLPSETSVRLINASGPRRDRVRSTRLKMQWLLVLTGRVRLWQRPRPVKGKRLKRLRNAT